MAVDMSQIFSKLAMPSPEFLRKDRFEPVANGKIYVGKTDTDPLNPANQIPVYAQQEDGSLVQVSQPIRINASGYPVYNGKAAKFITHTAASMKVMDVSDVEMWYWPNLFEYDSSQMWAVLASQFGADFVGTPVGTIQEQLNGYVTPWNFIGKAPYANEHEAIQAMLDYASANNKLVWCVGYTLRTNGILTGSNLKIVGGRWVLSGNDPRFDTCELVGGRWEGRSIWTKNTTIRECWLEKCRVRHDSGEVRILDSRFNGEVAGSNVTAIVIQGSQPGQVNPEGSIEVDGVVFSNGLNGILHQGGNANMRYGIYRNLAFFDMKGDGIELNVVNSTYNEGLVIENILLNNINATLSGSNWGIGIGIAGKGPYAWDADESMYCHDFTIRNVMARGVRQCVHVEVGRDFTIENCRLYPDVTKSNGTGLTTAGVYIAGSKRFTVDGISGEPVGSASVADTDIPLVDIRWGTRADDVRYIPASRDYTLRNVNTKRGRVSLSCDAYPGVGTTPATPNRVRVNDVNCYTFRAMGVATQLDLSDVTAVVWDCTGDLAAGGVDGAASSGQTIATKSVLNMVNCTAYDPNGFGGQSYKRCAYSHVSVVGGNVDANQRVTIIGRLGPMLGNVGKIFYPQIYPTATGHSYYDYFPTGREFDVGDMVFIPVWDADHNNITGTRYYIVTKAGAFIPDNDNNNIRAAAVGDKTLIQQKTPSGTSTGSPWVYSNQFSPGTRITIPGAGAGGAALNTVITRSPYQEPPGDTSALIKMDIADPIVTAVPAGTRIRATVPLETLPPNPPAP
ncbi:tail fibers protein [Kosakonia phage Kc166B]|nr:tail fibers protein [Kosakonia phage Kc166B]